jgi:hypothetical protein
VRSVVSLYYTVVPALMRVLRDPVLRDFGSGHFCGEVSLANPF